MTDPGPAVVALGGGHGLSATPVGAAADVGPAHRRRHGRRRRRLVGPAARRAGRAAARATCGWRCRRCATTPTGAAPGATCCSTGSRSTGDLDQHAVGNLLIVALWELLGDTVEGLDWVGRLLGARGRVLPMASVPLAHRGRRRATARAARARRARAERGRASPPGRIAHVRLVPADPPACPEAVAAVDAADWVVLGPGSWFTSVLPHLLVPEPARTRCTGRARGAIVTLNLVVAESGRRPA